MFATSWDRWLTAWGEGVRASPKAVVLADIESTRFLVVSDCAAALLGMTPEEMERRTYLELAEQAEEAAVTFALARSGLLDGVRSRRRLRRPDGAVIELSSSAWVVRSPGGRDVGLWVADDPSARGTGPTGPELRMFVPPRLTDWDDLRHGALLELDEDWRAVSPSPEAAALLHQDSADLRGTSLVELTHPDDVATLLMAMAQATTASEAVAPLRLHDGHGRWQPVWVLVSVHEVDGAQCFSVRLGKGAPSIPAWSADMLELTIREGEVVSRLLTGQRVATIAREMFLSQRTIRNHLTAVFRKAGVHSQDELIELLRRPQPMSGRK
jgi:PAS domain S-box-containing protein